MQDHSQTFGLIMGGADRKGEAVKLRKGEDFGHSVIIFTLYWSFKTKVLPEDGLKVYFSNIVSPVSYIFLSFFLFRELYLKNVIGHVT